MGGTFLRSTVCGFYSVLLPLDPVMTTLSVTSCVYHSPLWF